MPPSPLEAAGRKFTEVYERQDSLAHAAVPKKRLRKPRRATNPCRKSRSSVGPRADRNSSHFSGSAFPNLIPCAGLFPTRSGLRPFNCENLKELVQLGRSSNESDYLRTSDVATPRLFRRQMCATFGVQGRHYDFRSGPTTGRKKFQTGRARPGRPKGDDRIRSSSCRHPQKDRTFESTSIRVYLPRGANARRPLL
jgi:hypothetical protein